MPHRPIPSLKADVTPNHFEGQTCSDATSGIKIIRNSHDWTAIWKGACGQAVPPVDFDEHFAVAVFVGPKPTGGYGVEFLPPETDGKTAFIRYKMLKPAPGSFVTQAFTAPFAIKIFRKTKLKIKVLEVP